MADRDVTHPWVVWEVAALLGEGPAWFADEQALRFVDIKGGRVHRFDPATGGGSTIETGGMPSFVLPEQGGSVLVGAGNGVHRLVGDRLGDRIATIDMPRHNRTNDATVDGAGRIWLGTMDDAEERATGALYCLDGTGLRRMGGEAVVTNGPAVMRGEQCLYHVDSVNRRIWRHAISEGPGIDKGELFVELGKADGHPDGVVLDSEDCLWVALWDGWGLRRYSPSGELLLTVNLPCSRITKVAFGGNDLQTAYVTTARTGLDAAALASQPLAGSLFAFAAPAPGLRLPAARLG